MKDYIIIDKKVIEANQFTDYDTDLKCIEIRELLSQSKEVEVVNIRDEFQKWDVLFIQRKTLLEFDNYLVSKGYQLIKIK